MASVSVQAQISGIVTNIHFKEGQDLRCGDRLFTLDPGTLVAQRAQAEAVLARDRVRLKNASKEASHQEELFKKGLVAQDAWDTARTEAEALAATLRADEAELENTRIQLAYCRIDSPINGRAGETAVDVGDLVKVHDTRLVTINQIQPIEVSFTIPQQRLAEVRAQAAGAALGVRAFVTGGSTVVATGTLSFVDNAVDPASGTLRLKASFPNEATELWPGQFVNVRLTLGVEPNAIAVPSMAIQAGQKGSYVFVVNPDQTVELRPVTVDREHEDEAVVSQGLKAGERVVTDGHQRLVPGAKVAVQNGQADNPPRSP
jgi:multidrug efflux system membrane fusion protein